jgi:hypothetical protein
VGGEFVEVGGETDGLRREALEAEIEATIMISRQD